MDLIKITADEINISDALTVLSNSACGGTACFIGTTRDTFNGKKVLKLHYEAYESMAIKKLHKICEEMKLKWPIINVVLIHRIGSVPISEASVMVAANSVHRKEALEAVTYGIDAIKSDVPIWKREEYDDGTSNWKENCEFYRNFEPRIFMCKGTVNAVCENGGFILPEEQKFAQSHNSEITV